MPSCRCDLCPISFLTQEELTSHKWKHHNAYVSTPNSFQANQGSAGSRAGDYPWQSPERSLPIDYSVRVLNSALTPGSELFVAANTIYWMSRGRKCSADYSEPAVVKLEASDGPPSAKRRRGAARLSPLVQAATSKQVYPCNECTMVFPSYHALWGHKSGHRKVEAKFRATTAQINQVPLQLQQINHVPLQQQPQPQPQEAPPPAPPSPRRLKYLFDLNEPAPE